MTRNMKNQNDLRAIMMEEKLQKLSDEKDMLCALCLILLVSLGLVLFLV